MADGGIIFEVGLDTSGLKQGGQETVSELKKIGDRGGKAYADNASKHVREVYDKVNDASKEITLDIPTDKIEEPINNYTNSLQRMLEKTEYVRSQITEIWNSFIPAQKISEVSRQLQIPVLEQYAKSLSEAREKTSKALALPEKSSADEIYRYADGIKEVIVAENKLAHTSLSASLERPVLMLTQQAESLKEGRAAIRELEDELASGTGVFYEPNFVFWTPKQKTGIAQFEKAASRYKDVLTSLTKITTAQEPDMQSYKRTLDELAMEYNKAAAAGDEEAMAVIKQRYDEIANAAKRAATEIRNVTIAQDKNTNNPIVVPETPKGSVSKIAGIKAAFVDAAGSASKLGSLLLPLLNKFKKLGSVAANSIKRGMLAPIKLLLKPLSKVSSLFDRIKGILTRVVVMKTFRAIMQSLTSVINEQIEALYKWGQASKTGIGKELVRVMDLLYTKVNYLKNSVAALFSSFIRAFGPQVINLINKLIPVINKVNATIAAAFGQKKFLKAVEIPMSYADSLDKSNKKAKELKRSLMGFDALNRLDGDTDSSDDVDYSKMFEEASVAEEDIISLEKILKRFIELPLGEWGTKIGTKFSNSIKSITKTLEGISFTDIGTKIAEFFNGIIHSVEGVDIGHFIGEVLNDIIELIDGFIAELDTKDLGNDVAGIFVGIIDKLEEIDWNKVFSDLIDGATDFVSGFLNKLLEPDEDGNDAFVRLALLVVNGINTAFAKIKENDAITQNVHDLFYGITETVCTILKGLDWKLVGSVLLDCIKAAFEGINDADATAGVITEIIVAAFAAIKIGTLISKVVKIFKGSALFTGIFSTIKGMFSFEALKGFLTSGFMKAFGGISLVLSGITLAVQKFIDMFTNGFTWAKEALMLLGIALAAVGAVILGAPAVAAAVVAGIVAALATLVVVIKEHWEEIKAFSAKVGDWFKTKGEVIKKWFSDKWEDIKEILSYIPGFIEEKINNVKEKFTSVKEFFKGVWGEIKDGIKEFVNTGIGYFENFVNCIIRGINKVITALNGLKIDIPDWAEKISGVSSIGFNIPTISEVKIPRLATGAVLPANNPFLAVVGDQKHGTNIEAPLSTIEQAVENVVDRKLRALRIEPAPVIISGREVAKVVFQEHNDTVTRTGKTPLRGV